MNRLILFTLLLSLAAISACRTHQIRLQFTVGECIRACAPLAQHGFKPLWDTNGACLCVMAISPKTRRRSNKTLINNL
jgi:hypothetical protein